MFVVSSGYLFYSRLYFSSPNLEPGGTNAFYRSALKCPRSMCWYSNVPVGHNKLASTVKRLCGQARISGYWTNHSLQATATTRMYDIDCFGIANTEYRYIVTKIPVNTGISAVFDVFLRGQFVLLHLECSQIMPFLPAIIELRHNTMSYPNRTLQTMIVIDKLCDAKVKIMSKA